MGNFTRLGVRCRLVTGSTRVKRATFWPEVNKLGFLHFSLFFLFIFIVIIHTSRSVSASYEVGYVTHTPGIQQVIQLIQHIAVLHLSQVNNIFGI